jgi:hypothetical protein
MGDPRLEVVVTAFSITVFDERTMTATKHSVDAETGAGGGRSLASQFKVVPACEISFEHTSFFCGNPNCQS